MALLAACASMIPERGQLLPRLPRPPPPTPPCWALPAGPAIDSFGLLPQDSAAALDAFQLSCPVLLRRQDESGLTRPQDWQQACDAPPAGRAAMPRGFFASLFRGRAWWATARPLPPAISNPRSPDRAPAARAFEVPVYALPPDLVRCWRADTRPSERTGRAPLGRYDGQAHLHPTTPAPRSSEGALAGRGLEIGWAADAVEFFFLQIQGSGRLVTPEGEVIRIGYAGQNGHAYTGIGALMRERGLLGSGPGQYPSSMQGIMQYIRDNPRGAR
jgi:membrane-bound lytic murein transglycosylase A